MARRSNKGSGFSMRTEDAQQGGSLLGAEGPEKVRFDDCAFITAEDWNEDWKSDDASDYKPDDAPLFAAKLYKYDDDDNESDTPEAGMWGCGKGTRLQPTEDGERLEPAPGSNATGYTKGCNFYLFMESLIEAKGDEDWIAENGASGLNGLVAMVERQERKLKFRGEGEKTVGVLTITEILEEPGEEKPEPARGKGKKKAVKKTSPKPKPEPEEEEEEDEGDEVDVEEAAEAIITSILEDNPKGVLRPKLVRLVNAKLQEEDFEQYASEKAAIGKLLIDPKGKFLKGLDSVEVEGSKILPAE